MKIESQEKDSWETGRRVKEMWKKDTVDVVDRDVKKRKVTAKETRPIK